MAVGARGRDHACPQGVTAAVKLILVRNGGSARSIRLNWLSLAAGVALVFGIAFAFSAVLYPIVNTHFMVPGMIDQWREQLADQDARVQELETQAVAESGAVGRQLAQMQAQLWRMEAIGAQVAEVAEISLDEIGLNQPAPIGGPVGNCETTLDWPDLGSALDALAVDIRDREDELRVLESVLDNQEHRDAATPSGWPVHRGWVSSPYGRRVDPISGKLSWHTGIDIAGQKGADVVAVAAGIVVYSGPRAGYGKLVEIDHGDGVMTRYAHHQELRVETGDIVKRGDVVGSLGATGRTTGFHVHVEVLKNGRHLNPSRYLTRRKA